MPRQFSSTSIKDRELHTIFSSYTDDKDVIKVDTLRKTLEKEGLHKYRIDEFLKFMDPEKTGDITFEQFRKLKEMDDSLVEKALKGNLTLPSFNVFTKELEEIYKKVQPNKAGKQADYIPQLTRVDAEYFGIAVCTVDAQVWSHGDAKIPFTLQSTQKPLTYCMALEDKGEAHCIQHVGHEPSGKKFNAFVLNDKGLPHNPMINSGAIMTASLLYPEMDSAQRFAKVLKTLNDMAGYPEGGKIGFDNSVYLSELETADRNFALAYLLKDAKAFHNNKKTDIRKNLQFYFQLCSITATTEDVAAMAATFASGGICPITGRRVFKPETCRSGLSLMYSCGMYDYSGEFAFSVGLPAKSGVSGILMVVVPNVMGIAIFSPRLDKIGNSVRGVEFCQKLVENYNLHVFDSLSGVARKKDIRTRDLSSNSKIKNISEMLTAAANGDLLTIRTLVGSGVSVNISDYDGRTPLHLAAVEGRLSVAEYLLSKGANVDAKDRWDFTVMDEAVRANHQSIIDLLKHHKSIPEEERQKLLQKEKEKEEEKKKAQKAEPPQEERKRGGGGH